MKHFTCPKCGNETFATDEIIDSECKCTYPKTKRVETTHNKEDSVHEKEV